MIQRPEYIKKFISFKDKELIKIVTGVRRCGKSTLFELYQAELLKTGIQHDQILNINMDDPVYYELKDWQKLYNYIKNRLIPDKKNYIFIDEIQNVSDFEKAASGLFIKKNVDLYLTGSNSRVQSGEWATLLAGRYVEIHVLPLSFKEYHSAKFTGNVEETFRNYLENSSFPYTLQLDSDKKLIRDYLGGIYSTIVLRDVMENKKIRDAGRLEAVIKFMADNIGNLTSIKKISDTMASDGIKIMPLTIENYMDAFRSSYILYKTGRYDVKGKKILQTMDKYYLADIGLRFYLLGDRITDRGRMLENTVFLELLRRGFRIYTGKINENEIDFVAEGTEGTVYYQVADTVMDESTLKRELSPLNAVKDHNPKIILTRDYSPVTSHNGIRQINIYDWLLQSRDW